MPERSSGARGRRGPFFDYVTQIDPALSTFGWKIVGLAHAAMVIPALGAFLPRGAVVKWPWLIAVIVVAGVIGLVNLISFVRMVRSRGYGAPPVVLVLVEVVAATVAAGVLSYAIGGTTGIYRPLVFVPTLLLAMIGNRRVIAVSWAVATATVTVSAVHTGTVGSAVAPMAISYGVVWGTIAIMVHQLAVAALHSDDQVGGLAEMAGIAARSNSLEDGVAEVLPVMGALTDAAAAGAFRVVVDPDRPGAPTTCEPFAGWTAGRAGGHRGQGEPPDPVDAPTVAEVDEARARHGVALRGDRAVLVTEGAEGDVVVIVLQGAPRRPFDDLMTRFNLERVAAQVAVLVDRSRYVARLEDLGRTDELTGLANRRSLFENLERACGAARRRGESLAVVMTDLDHFKDYNDTFGHLAGDDLLRNFATKLRDRTRSIDLVARYGGEEFVLMLPGIDTAGAHALVDKLQERFRSEATLQGITFSAGIAVWDGAEDVESLIGRADTALYRAKAAGRDRTVINLADHPRGGRTVG